MSHQKKNSMRIYIYQVLDTDIDYNLYSQNFDYATAATGCHQ